MKMEKIIERCNKGLDEAASKKVIPSWLWESCKGVAIINCTEAGFVFSINEGDGVVLKRNEDGTWGPPSAIMLTGVGAGAIFGAADKTVFLFPMTQLGLKMLSGQTTAKAGIQFGVAAGPHGAESETAANAGDKGADMTFSYVIAKGAYLNVGVEGAAIDAVDGQNKHFYGKEVSAEDIVLKPGSVEIPDGPKGKVVEELYEKLRKLGGPTKQGEDDRAGIKLGK